MSKRSNFVKVERDYYPTTDPKVKVPEFINSIKGKTYAEPCYGHGDLENLIINVASLRYKSDIRATNLTCKVQDAMALTKEQLKDCDLIITNPPFTKSVLLPMIDKFISLKPTWLLLPADYMHNQYFRPYMNLCTKVVSIGRICWFPTDEGKRVASTDNFAWYFWPKKATGDSDTLFYTGG
jgi:hypothetical protein